MPPPSAPVGGGIRVQRWEQRVCSEFSRGFGSGSRPPAWELRVEGWEHTLVKTKTWKTPILQAFSLKLLVVQARAESWMISCVSCEFSLHEFIAEAVYKWTEKELDSCLKYTCVWFSPYLLMFQRRKSSRRSWTRRLHFWKTCRKLSERDWAPNNLQTSSVLSPQQLKS